MSGDCTCFYCRQAAPCLCDTMIEHIVMNVDHDQQNIDLEDSLDYETHS